MKVTVHPVRTRADLHRFMRVPYALHRHDNNWIPPLRRSMLATFDTRRNPFHEEAEVQHFVAADSRARAVGRIAAIIHPAYIERYGAKAFFGFFESENDEGTARVLLEAVENWAADRGMQTVAGPYSYTSSQDIGFLVDGFDTPPALLQAHNPTFYPALVESNGYHRAFQMCTHTATRVAYLDRAADLIVRGERILSSNGLNVRSVNLREYDKELETLRLLYNRSFACHPESLPISRRLFHAQAADLRSVLNPSLVRIIQSGERPVAFSVLVPNLNEVLVGRSGRLTPGLVLEWRWLLRRIRSVVILMIGADPEMFGAGIGRCLAAEIARTVASGQYDAVHTTWIHEKNGPSHAILKYLGCSPNRRYAVFEKNLC